MKILNTFYHSLKKQHTIYIENDSKFLTALKEIHKKKEICIDTEFTWRKTYFPRLSLIQIGIDDKLFIIDALKLNKFDELNNIFHDKNITKVFHSSRGDISVLKNSIGASFHNIFDTQIAHKLIYRISDQISYKKLVDFYFYKTLSKSQTNSDWEKRPLSKEQIQYAAEDIKYLLNLKNIQLKRLKNKRLIQDLKIICEKEILLAEKDFSISRLERLRKKQKNISKEECDIFLWRENRAKERNVPPNNIFKDKYLRKIRELIQSKKIKELDWIIEDEDDRKFFLRNF